MGSVFSVFRGLGTMLFRNTSGMPIEGVPISYVKVDDYSIAGAIRPHAYSRWNKALHSMIFLDIATRRQLWPVIKKRMKRMENSVKYASPNLMALKKQFDGWNDKKILSGHDLFQAFEVDGDGIIEKNELLAALDNLGDNTSEAERLFVLQKVDEDNTGYFDFEEFLGILWTLETDKTMPESLVRTFADVENDMTIVRYMSTVQQIKAGFF